MSAGVCKHIGTAVCISIIALISLISCKVDRTRLDGQLQAEHGPYESDRLHFNSSEEGWRRAGGECRDRHWSPKSNKDEVLSALRTLFSEPRKSMTSRPIKLKGALHELGFKEVVIQEAPDRNTFVVLPGKHWQTERDRILLIGAHWDTKTDEVPGVVDNGSGCTCILEIARLIKRHECKFDHTIIIVWFDNEEEGLFGSNSFVNDYLYPELLEKYGSRFAGAYLADMIMVNETERGSQWLPERVKKNSPEFVREIERESERADFLAIISRTSIEAHLDNAFRDAWNQLGNAKRRLKYLHCKLPKDRLPNREEKLAWFDLSVSDHYSFWYPRMRHFQPGPDYKRASLNAVLLTDLSLWRKSFKDCYHKTCDNLQLLTKDNLIFLQQVIDTLMRTLINLGGGCCSNH